MRIWPEVGVAKRARQRPSVVLPEPDSPTMPSVSPRANCSDTPPSASTRRRLDLNSDRVSKRRVRSRTSSTGGSDGARSRARKSPRGRAASKRCVYGCWGRSSTSAAVPCSTMRPACITTTRSAISETTSKSCVMNSTPLSWRPRKSFSKRSTWACEVTSSAVVGSSAMIRPGSITKAMAIITR
ncbi:hypothetical protein D3C72_1575700 [compost metagenome]